ncbi:MAG: hypothetical protein HUJ30_04025 [Gammaproteobacteria bacterium]|nr:hypothetical protein [Gammaproteobacteria bacterium]
MEILISPKAQRALNSLVSPIHVEMELYFSCMIRKQVNYPSTPHKDARVISTDYPNLRLYFRPVMTRQCSIEESSTEPMLESFPMKYKPGLLPKWFRLDHDGSQWQGEFGYSQ